MSNIRSRIPLSVLFLSTTWVVKARDHASYAHFPTDIPHRFVTLHSLVEPFGVSGRWSHFDDHCRAFWGPLSCATDMPGMPATHQDHVPTY